MSLEFTAKGTPKELALAIEQYAHGQGSVTAIVVPWESSHAMLSMSVTSVKTDGWAIEHTNLGTITLAEAGTETTAVTLTAHDPGDTERARLTNVFERFAEQLRQRFKA